MFVHSEGAKKLQSTAQQEMFLNAYSYFRGSILLEILICSVSNFPLEGLNFSRPQL